MINFVLDTPTICIRPTGSRYTESPPKEGTDEDYIVLVENLKKTEKFLSKTGWDDCLDDNDKDERYNEEKQQGINWSAWRKGELNLILTDNLAYFVRFIAATELCKSLNIKDKNLRVDIFRCVKFGDEAHQLNTWIETI